MMPQHEALLARPRKIAPVTKLVFNSSPTPTLGVELEMALVDNKTLALASAIEPLLACVPSLPKRVASLPATLRSSPMVAPRWY